MQSPSSVSALRRFGTHDPSAQHPRTRFFESVSGIINHDRQCSRRKVVSRRAHLRCHPLEHCTVCSVPTETVRGVHGVESLRRLTIPGSCLDPRNYRLAQIRDRVLKSRDTRRDRRISDADKYDLLYRWASFLHEMQPHPFSFAFRIQHWFVHNVRRPSTIPENSGSCGPSRQWNRCSTRGVMFT